MAVGEPGEADALERVGRGLLGDRLVQEVVVGVLQQQRDTTGGLDAAAGGRAQAAEVAQQGRLAGAVAPHERDAIARGDRDVDAAQGHAPARELAPDPAGADGERLARSAPTAGPRRRRRRGCRCLVEQSMGAQRGARLLDAAGRWAQARALKQARAPGSAARASARRPTRERRAAWRRRPRPRRAARSRGRRATGSARGGARPGPPPCPTPR